MNQKKKNRNTRKIRQRKEKNLSRHCRRAASFEDKFVCSKVTKWPDLERVVYKVVGIKGHYIYCQPFHKTGDEHQVYEFKATKFRLSTPEELTKCVTDKIKGKEPEEEKYTIHWKTLQGMFKETYAEQLAELLNVPQNLEPRPILVSKAAFNQYEKIIVDSDRVYFAGKDPWHSASIVNIGLPDDDEA